MPTLTDFATFTVTLSFDVIGKVDAGFRIDVPFEGTATSSHWEGEWPVAGIDYITRAESGVQSLDIRGRIGSGKGAVAYRAIGRATESGPKELLVFETANPDLAFLNSTVGVAVGSVEGDQLTLNISLLD